MYCSCDYHRDTSRHHQQSVLGWQCPTQYPAPPPSYLQKQKKTGGRSQCTQHSASIEQPLQWSDIRYAVAESRSSCLLLINMVRAEYGTWKHCDIKKKTNTVTNSLYCDKWKQIVCRFLEEGTNRLHRLEEAVKYQKPDDLPFFKRRHIPNQEVRQHCERSGTEDPGEKTEEFIHRGRQNAVVFSVF